MGAHQLCLAKQEDVLLPLSDALPIQYTVLEGKHLEHDVFAGALVKLSRKGGEIEASQRVARWSNLRIRLQGEYGKQYPGHLYAKVVGQTPDGQAGLIVRFTAVPPDVAMFLQTLLASTCSETG